jgi:hypothetical protein
MLMWLFGRAERNFQSFQGRQGVVRGKDVDVSVLIFLLESMKTGFERRLTKEKLSLNQNKHEIGDQAPYWSFWQKFILISDQISCKYSKIIFIFVKYLKTYK